MSVEINPFIAKNQPLFGVYRACIFPAESVLTLIQSGVSSIFVSLVSFRNSRSLFLSREC